jgi:hypothetical protein
MQNHERFKNQKTLSTNQIRKGEQTSKKVNSERVSSPETALETQ